MPKDGSASPATSRSPTNLQTALGGVGDAAYARGRYGTALLSFQRCVDLAAQHGHGRIEVANRSMIAICRLFAGSTDEAEAEALRAIESATRIGRHRRAEIIARHAAALACT